MTEPITFKPKAKRKPRNAETDVFKKLDMKGGDKEQCWEWQGRFHIGNGGEQRAIITIAGVRRYVHRLVWELYNGRALAHKEVVRHKCDNTKCCNPFHLIVGTQKDNVQDMLERERTGHKHADVKKIMQLLEIGCSSEYVSVYMKKERDVEIDASTVRRIKRRRYYRFIEWEWGDKYALDKGFLTDADFKDGKLLPYAEARNGEQLASDPDDGIVDNTNNTTEQHNGNEHASEGSADAGQAD